MQLFDLVTSGLPNKQARSPSGDASSDPGAESAEAADGFGAAMSRTLAPEGEAPDGPDQAMAPGAQAPVAPKSPAPDNIAAATAGTSGSADVALDMPAAPKALKTSEPENAVAAHQRLRGGPQGRAPGLPEITRSELPQVVGKPVKASGRGATLLAQPPAMAAGPNMTDAASAVDRIDLPEAPRAIPAVRPGAPDTLPVSAAPRASMARADAPNHAPASVERPNAAPQLARATVNLPPTAAPVAVAAVTTGGPLARQDRPAPARSPVDSARIAAPGTEQGTERGAVANDQPREIPVRPAIPPVLPPGPGPHNAGDHYASRAVAPSEALGVAVPPPQAQGSAPAAMPPPAVVERGILPQIVQAVTPGSAPGTVNVMLDPPELGRIDIVLELTDQTLRATLTVERPATGELIRRHMDQLAEQFREAGFEDIDLNFSDRRAGHGRPGDAGPAMAETPAEKRSAAPAAARPVRLSPAGAAGMDLRL